MALGREMVAPSLELCDRGRLVLLENASHWVQHEAAESVTDLLKRFLAGGLAGLDRPGDGAAHRPWMDRSSLTGEATLRSIPS